MEHGQGIDIEYSEAKRLLQQLDQYYQPPRTPTLMLRLADPVPFAAITVDDPTDVMRLWKAMPPEHRDLQLPGGGTLPVFVVPAFGRDGPPPPTTPDLSYDRTRPGAVPTDDLSPIASGVVLGDGTAGWPVVCAGERYVITAWHVARRFVLRTVEAGHQPRILPQCLLSRGGSRLVDIGVLQSFVDLLPVHTRSDNWWDLAILRLDQAMPVRAFPPEFDLPPPTRVAVPRFGATGAAILHQRPEISKFRRSEGRLLGLIHTQMAGLDHRAPHLECSMKDQLCFSLMSEPGDSGALIFVENGRDVEALGLLFAERSDPDDDERPTRGAHLAGHVSYQHPEFTPSAARQCLVDALLAPLSIASPLAELRWSVRSEEDGLSCIDQLTLRGIAREL